MSQEDPKANAKAAPAANPPEGGNVDKIRDILFGSQMRDYEQRFLRLEETLLKEAAELRESTRKRFDQLESHLKKELETLQNKLKNEREDRTAESKQLGRDLKDAADSLEKKIRELEDQTGDAASSLRQSLLDQSNSLTDEMKRRQDEAIALLERRFQELRNSKTDRASLAAMLTEVAMRLNDEFRIPGSEE